MFVLFSIPKEFIGEFDIIQRNAIRNWLSFPYVEKVILFSQNDPEIKDDNCHKLEIVKDFPSNDNGTPYLTELFKLVKSFPEKIVIYANCDIIFQNLGVSIINFLEHHNGVLLGRRRDVNIKSYINFNLQTVFPELYSKSVLHSKSGLDYFIFKPLLLSFDVKPFLVGRVGWDNWFLFQLNKHRIPVFDATGFLCVFHQNHSYSHSTFGKARRVEGPEMKYNLSLCRNGVDVADLNIAYNIISSEGYLTFKPFRFIYSKLINFYAIRLAMKLIRVLYRFFC